MKLTVWGLKPQQKTHQYTAIVMCCTMYIVHTTLTVYWWIFILWLQASQYQLHAYYEWLPLLCTDATFVGHHPKKLANTKFLANPCTFTYGFMRLKDVWCSLLGTTALRRVLHPFLGIRKSPSNWRFFGLQLKLQQDSFQEFRTKATLMDDVKNIISIVYFYLLLFYTVCSR